MRVRVPFSLLAVVAALAACGPEPIEARPPPAVFCAGCDADHPINARLLDVMREAEHEPRLAGARELCGRLSVDLLGKPMTAAEAEHACSGRDLEDVITEMQGTPDYLIVSARHWQSRFQLNDIITDWRYLKELFALVDELHTGALRYDDFAVAAIASPALNLGDFDVRMRVSRVFRSFAGRAASEAEQVELGALFRPWLISQEMDPDFPTIYWNHAYVLPGLCAPLARCSTTLFGGGALDFGEVADPFAPIYVEDLTDEQRAQLRVPGELLARQPFFAEAAADEILDRLLDWDDGERSIRTPGFLFPEVRQVVADYIADTGDYPGAERMVLTSWLYTQTSEVSEDGVRMDDDDDFAALPPPFTHGPTKAMNAEQWLAALSHASSYEMGACDDRYGDGFPYFLLFDAAMNQGTLTMEDLYTQIYQLHEMREDRMPIIDYFGVPYPDTEYQEYARQLGGCPGFQNIRQRPAGVSYALLQEGIAAHFCSRGFSDRARPTGEITVESVVRHQVPLLLGREARGDDVDAVRAACGADCDAETLVTNTCVALAGSAEFLFR